MKNKQYVKSFTRQFYRGNGIYFVLAIIQTVLFAVANLLISWLMQQIMERKGYFYSLYTVSQ